MADVGAAFVELASGVEKSRPKPKCRRDSFAVTDDVTGRPMEFRGCSVKEMMGAKAFFYVNGVLRPELAAIDRVQLSGLPESSATVSFAFPEVSIAEDFDYRDDSYAIGGDFRVQGVLGEGIAVPVLEGREAVMPSPKTP